MLPLKNRRFWVRAEVTRLGIPNHFTAVTVLFLRVVAKGTTVHPRLVEPYYVVNVVLTIVGGIAAEPSPHLLEIS